MHTPNHQGVGAWRPRRCEQSRMCRNHRRGRSWPRLRQGSSWNSRRPVLAYAWIGRGWETCGPRRAARLQEAWLRPLSSLGRCPGRTLHCQSCGTPAAKTHGCEEITKRAQRAMNTGSGIVSVLNRRAGAKSKILGFSGRSPSTGLAAARGDCVKMFAGQPSTHLENAESDIDRGRVRPKGKHVCRSRD